MTEQKNIARRDLLAAGAVALSGAGFVALADSHEGGHHHHAATKSEAALATDLAHCIQIGEACLAHCVMLVKKKDTSIADCMASVIDMLPVCRATAQLVAGDSSFAKDQAKVCLSVCEACQKECEKHKKHAACKASAESCGKLVKSLKTYLA